MVKNLLNNPGALKNPSNTRCLGHSFISIDCHLNMQLEVRDRQTIDKLYGCLRGESIFTIVIFTFLINITSRMDEYAGSVMFKRTERLPACINPCYVWSLTSLGVCTKATSELTTNFESLMSFRQH